MAQVGDKIFKVGDGYGEALEDHLELELTY